MPQVEKLELPADLLVIERNTVTPVTCELGRVSITGFVDIASRNELVKRWMWPLPLMIVDGQEAEPQRPSSDGMFHSFYTIGSRIMSENTISGILVNTWESTISIPHDQTISPWTYLGNGGWPSEAEAIVFDNPIKYEQELFDQKVAESGKQLP